VWSGSKAFVSAPAAATVWPVLPGAGARCHPAAVSRQAVGGADAASRVPNTQARCRPVAVIAVKAGTSGAFTLRTVCHEGAACASAALAGAAGVLAGAVPERAGLAAQLTERILGRSPLHGTGNLGRPGPGQPEVVFSRRSCCLYYRIPGGALCGDCVLAPAAR